MYLEYLFALVVFSLAFKLLNALAAAVAAVLWLPVQRLSNKAGVVFEFLLQLFFCTTFAAMFSAVTLLFARDDAVEHPSLYFLTGIAFMFISLSGNFAGKDQRAKGSSLGAGWGLLLGIPLFIVIYEWPFVAFWLPGLVSCLAILFRFSNWLVSYRIVRWGISAYMAYLVLGWGSLVFSIGVGGLLSVFHREARTTTSGSTTQ